MLPDIQNITALFESSRASSACPDKKQNSDEEGMLVE
jgi:hypothetical protein